MKTLTLLLALIASSQAVDIHGCERLPNNVTITNFTYFHNTAQTANISIQPDYLRWNVPDLRLSCNATQGVCSDAIAPNKSLSLGCAEPNAKEATYAFFTPSTDNVGSLNTTIEFSIWAQCAASQYFVWYEGNVLLDCEEDAQDGLKCGPRGNVSANYKTWQYLPPMRGPDPKAPKC